jgi:putative ABC transport system permease protein
MSLWSRVINVFRPDQVNSQIDEEMQSHLEEAIAAGRDPEEAHRAFGSMLRKREDSRDTKLASWLDSLRSDLIFGWRQLLKSKVSSAAAALSLALTIGACVAAFRLADAALLRPLPVAEAGRLFYLEYEYTDDRTGQPERSDTFEYPLFREMRAAAKEEAELLAISYADRIDLTYGSDQEMEKAFRQYCSGSMFGSFGLKAAAGRLLTAADDLKPGAHPYAVISYDYWLRRFGRDPKAIGRNFRVGTELYQIVGVAPKGFTGTETGTPTDLFVPAMMNAKAIDNPGWGWFRTWVRLKPGAPKERVRQKLQAAWVADRRERVKTWGQEVPKDRVEGYVNAPVSLEPAAAGVSRMQTDLRRPLAILGAVIALVLLIACANVANLMSAQAEARAREMALRVSIGAGRCRLTQLVLVQSALLAAAASVLGGVFAWRSLPLVLRMVSTPESPARLVLPPDWRVLGFAAAVAVGVMLLFGLAPALRASAVKPMSALRGGDDPHRKRRLMKALIAAQVAFCFVINLIAGLFVTTFERLSKQPAGFSAERVLTLEAVSDTDQPPAYWDQVLDRLRSVNGVQSAALCGWALMSGNAWTSDIRVNGRPEFFSPYFLTVSPGWFETMRIPLIGGRDFRRKDLYPDVAIVNQAFAKHYFAGQNPVGKVFEREVDKKLESTRIVGYVRDARYRDMREPVRPTVYVPFNSADNQGGLRSNSWGTFVVRTEVADPARLAPLLRVEVPRARPEFRVSNTRTQQELIDQHTMRERLLASLSLFFAILALVLAGVGLYGVLHFSVVQRRKEIGIRMALGARATHVARHVTTDVFAMFMVGGLTGLSAGLISERFLQSLLYEVKASDPAILAAPALTICAAAVLAALPPLLRAVRTVPAETLRPE